ncbi:MAG TPA: hypothetical protein VGA07_03470 [Anaerolineales bacterium]
MSLWLSRIRRPVRREGVELYLLLMLLSFGGSVAFTRLFLELTGYPQLGGGSIHIAHVLWGGLLLYLAALLPLIFANRWVYVLGAVLGGVGVGLFIDEVGKFITQTNNYFEPLAAPIVYAFFLLSVLLYFRVSRPAERDPRAELYQVLEAMEEVLDHDLDAQERQELDLRLKGVAQDDRHPAFSRLARELLEFLRSDQLRLAPQVPGRLQRWVQQVGRFEARWLTRPRLRAGLAGGLAALGAYWAAHAAGLLLGGESTARLAEKLSELVALGRLPGERGLDLFSLQLVLEGAVGALILLGAVLLLAGNEPWGLALCYFGLLLTLAGVNLLTFYFEQFSTIVGASVQLLLLLGMSYYRRRFARSRPRGTQQMATPDPASISDF